ncbi:rhodopsin-like [Acipenser oxyrinchus oxyrinchus]|uniref:Rhodopsin-like n=1 Tax=Acipenser oxyrinchus oxyrinchus TaxID=40147 RepID=A0AAD8LSB4_ACIOX|nr:rhodopsin-like [Acipenser oxyrinchus oxyrinchus]
MEEVALIESLIRAIMCLLGIVGNNLLAFRLLPSKMSRVRTSEVLLINLAISNLITNYLVDLPDTIADFAGSWYLGETYCSFFLFCSELSETSSILATLLISVFWYQKLVGSLRRGNAPVLLESLRLSSGIVLLTWVLALIFSAPLLFYTKVDNKEENGTELRCNDHFPTHTSKQTYEVLYLTLANAVPIALMVFTNLRIVVTLLMHRKSLVSFNHASEEQHAAPQTNQPIPNLPGQPTVEENVLPSHGELERNGSTSSENPPGVSPPATVSSESNGNSLQPSKVHTIAASVPARSTGTSSPVAQIRAAKSVVAVASVFLICWVVHLLLRIVSNVNMSPLIVEIASYIAASYTCIIPYIILYGVKKLSCQCWK